MRREESCGAILFTKEEGKRLYILIMEANGSYGLPKGHKRISETDEETALREIKEETGIDATIIKGMKRTIKYPVPLHNSVKEVVYFVAKYENQVLAPIDSDILCAKKFTLEAALSVLKFSQIRDLLVEADYMLDILGE